MTDTKTADPTTAQPGTADAPPVTDAAPGDTTALPQGAAVAGEAEAAGAAEAAEAAKPSEGDDWPTLRASVLKRFADNPDAAWEFSEAEEFKPVLDSHTRRVHEELEAQFRTALGDATQRWESGKLHGQLAGHYGSLLEKLEELDEQGVAGAAKLLDKLEALSEPYRETYRGEIARGQANRDAATFRQTFLGGLRPRERDEMERFIGAAKDWDSVLKQYVKLHEPKMRERIEGEIRERVEAELRAEKRAADGEPVAPAGGGGGGAVTYRTKAEARNLHATGKINNEEMRRVRADPTIPDM